MTFLRRPERIKKKEFIFVNFPFTRSVGRYLGNGNCMLRLVPFPNLHCPVLHCLLACARDNRKYVCERRLIVFRRSKIMYLAGFLFKCELEAFLTARTLDVKMFELKWSWETSFSNRFLKIERLKTVSKVVITKFEVIYLQRGQEEP